jgi:hypothetical protein
MLLPPSVRLMLAAHARAARVPLARLCAPPGPSASAHGVHAPDGSALHSVGVGDAGLAPAVLRLDEAHGAGGGAHDDGVGGRAAGVVANALEQVAVRHAGRCEEHLCGNPNSDPAGRGRAAGGGSPTLTLQQAAKEPPGGRPRGAPARPRRGRRRRARASRRSPAPPPWRAPRRCAGTGGPACCRPCT